MKQKRKSREIRQEEENLNEEIDYEQALKNHKRKRLVVALSMIAVIVVIALGCYIYYQNKVYTEYNVKHTKEIDYGGTSSFTAFGDYVLRINSDGFSYLTEKENVWNAAYEMDDMVMDICEDYVAVGEKNGNTIHISNTSGPVGTVETTYPLVKVEVSADGVIAALSEDETANYIEVTAADGTQLVTGKTVLEGNGYPLDMSLSADGTKMIVSYLYVSGGVLQSKVVFYNFSDVGMNEVDRMVGGFNQYEDMLVPEVDFISEDVAIAVADGMLSIYSMKQKPSLTAEFSITQEIVDVFSNDEYIGIITETDQADTPYNLIVYDVKGKEIRNSKEARLYDTYQFVDNMILMYDETHCRVESVRGKVKFDRDIDGGIVDMVATDKAYEYLLVQSDRILRIRLN
ncbi:MAG: hypothetical protein E7269_02925 [Lachnospiraceae bacterium]|nr:hypothetical protein [Lachnospiraceae bacterium]